MSHFRQDNDQAKKSFRDVSLQVNLNIRAAGPASS
jgi:hypothetical protein